MSEADQVSLRSSEWILTGSLFLIIASLFTLSKIQAYQFSKETAITPVILVPATIDGAVARPGTYELPRGTPIEAALKKAKPHRFADLRHIDRNAPMSQEVHLTIEHLQELTIYVTGAVVQEGSIRVTPGTRISDLKKIVQIAPNGDTSFFKKRRFLSDGETIEVPYIHKQLEESGI